MQNVILWAQYSVRPCSFVTAFSPEAHTVTFITIFGLSVVVWFFHSVARGLSTQPSPEIEQKSHYITLNSKNQVKVAKYQKGFSYLSHLQIFKPILTLFPWIFENGTKTKILLRFRCLYSRLKYAHTSFGV